MSLREEIIGSCEICSGSGWQDGQACECMLKFRVYNRLLKAGFSKYSLDFSDREEYQLPMIESGEEFVQFFLKDPEFVEDKGLSLYIYSQDKGRGKTTLAHRIALETAGSFVDKDNYSTFRTYKFVHVEDLLQDFRAGNEESWRSTWLVLDDLGNEDRYTEWKKSLFLSSFQRVLHYRRDKRLPTIITSNYQPGDLSRIYQGELDSLLEIHPDGQLGGSLYKSVQVGGAEDLRTIEGVSEWPEEL